MVVRRDPPAHHGYMPIYRDGEVNHCPGCGRSNWLMGRITAECAFCATAMPLEHPETEGSQTADNFWKHDMLRHGHFDGYSHASNWDQTAVWE
jgi:hypothetical protein